MGNGVGVGIRLTGRTPGDETPTAPVPGDTDDGVETGGAVTTGFGARVGAGTADGADTRTGTGFGTTLELSADHVLGSTTTNRSPLVFKR